MFDDVKRMDKRQFLYQVLDHQDLGSSWTSNKLDISPSGPLVWHDRVVCSDDLEGLDGGHRIGVPHRGRPLRFHGAGFLPGRPALPHQL